MRILLFLPRQDVTVCLTSPPLISTLGTIVAKLKGGAVVPWVMDLNPDEAVAAGWLKAGGIAERTLTFIQNWSFRRASRIIALDRFMADRLKAKEVHAEVIHTDAPWSHDQAIQYDVAAREAFRAEHSLTGKFVVMYSGNHSPCHPLDAVLAAADDMKGDERLHFLFVGGGSEFKKVQAFAKARMLKNITCLPYQPMEKLSGSLSAADLHLVVMGDPFVGIVHPCKIYNILTLGIPFLFIGPDQSHGSDLARRLNDPAHGRVAHKRPGHSVRSFPTRCCVRSWCRSLSRRVRVIRLVRCRRMGVATARPSKSALQTHGPASVLAVGRFGVGAGGVAMSSAPNTPT